MIEAIDVVLVDHRSQPAAADAPQPDDRQTSTPAIARLGSSAVGRLVVSGTMTMEFAALRARRLIRKEPGALGHWLWLGGVNGNGHPYLSQDGRLLLVSRVMWASEYGDPPLSPYASRLPRNGCSARYRLPDLAAGRLPPLRGSHV